MEHIDVSGMVRDTKKHSSMKYQKIVPIGFSFLIVVLHSFFLTPNYDDGFNAYFISNTIDFVNPFFSDYFNTRFVVLKIPVLII